RFYEAFRERPIKGTIEYIKLADVGLQDIPTAVGILPSEILIARHLRSLAVKTKFVPVCVEILDPSTCPLPYNFTIDSPTFQACKTSVKIAEAKSMWMLIAACTGGVLIVILLIWFCIYRRRKKRNKKLRAAAIHRKSLVISPKNAINKQEKEFHCNHNDELLCCDTA
ncbi:hypothetical protein DOY81_009291, partial [Sarcophaga bullata]